MILLVRTAGAAYCACAAAGTAIAIKDDLPANFAHWDLSGGNITRDFVIGAGTALSAPLVMIVVLAVLLVLCGRPTRAGDVSLGLLIPLAIAFVIGMLGEPVARSALGSPGSHIDRTIVVVAALALPVVIAAAAQTAYQIFGQGRS